MNASEKDYYERVYEVVRRIPSGRVTTYGAVASHLGIASGARMVGYALNGSADRLPAHRVVNRLGELSGREHFPDDTMRERLRQEGVTFVEPYRVDLDQHFWNPSDPNQ
ncbi:MAG: MGMT family protein [Balneolaceae bacterium]|nr:MGMT family protein [Balneolaceae bacterium]